MKLTVTETTATNAPCIVENDLFSWFYLQDDYLTCKKTGREIYRFAYMRTEGMGSEKITDQAVIDAIKTFWLELKKLKNESNTTQDHIVHDRDNTAIQVSELLNDDGQKFETADGVEFDDLMESKGAVVSFWKRTNMDDNKHTQVCSADSTTVTCYRFDDNSAIISVGNEWDMLEGNGWDIKLAELNND